MIKPTCEDLVNESGFVEVHRESDDSWRHGSRVTQVWRREADDTFWQAYYRLSTDGETNELKEGLATIMQVEPYTVSVTKYRPVVEGGK